jgi:hypothetical protein
MNNEMVTIGAHEAQVHFPEILENEELSFKELAAKARVVQNRLKANTGTIDVRAYIHEGRK